LSNVKYDEKRRVPNGGFWSVLVVIVVLVFAGGWWGIRSCNDEDDITSAPTVLSTSHSNDSNASNIVVQSFNDAAINGGSPAEKQTTDDVVDGQCRVHGMVIDQNDKPVTNARLETLVKAYPSHLSHLEVMPDARWQEEEATVNPDGTFDFVVFTHCPEGVAALTDDNRRGECRRSNCRQAPNTVECELVVEQTWDIRGIVTNHEGQPIKDARVALSQSTTLQQWQALLSPIMIPDGDAVKYDPHVDVMDRDFDNMWTPHDFTNEQGKFTIGSVWRDDWSLMVEKDGYERTFAVQAEENLTRGIQLHLEINPITCWTIRVIDNDGKRIVGARVLVDPVLFRMNAKNHDNATNANGETEVCELSNSNVVIRVFSPENSELRVPDSTSNNLDQSNPVIVKIP